MLVLVVSLLYYQCPKRDNKCPLPGGIPGILSKKRDLSHECSHESSPHLSTCGSTAWKDSSEVGTCTLHIDCILASVIGIGDYVTTQETEASFE